MKKVLCFGDSNTNGYVPAGGGLRFDEDIRWPAVLQKQLGNDYLIIEEGFNNRTGFCENPKGFDFCGYKVLPQVLAPDLDCVILGLGINDLQFLYETNSEIIKNGLINLIKIIKEKSPKAKILVLSPSRLNKGVLKGYFSSMFDETSIEKSLLMGKIYEEVSKEHNCYFLDLDKIAKTSEKDGLHYDEAEHKKIADEIFEILTLKIFMI